MKNPKIRILNFYLLLFYLFILIILLCSGYSYSKYKSEHTEIISSNIAKPIFIIQKEDPKIIKTTSSFENYEYHFTIKNYDNNIFSDVLLAYRIIVDVGNNAIAYKLIDGNGNEVDFMNDRSSTFILDNHKKSEQAYKLVITKQDGQIKAGDIKINVEGNQIING